MAKKKKKNKFSQGWDLYLLYVFIISRLVLNLEIETLSIFFAVVYAIFLVMLFYRVRFFTTLFVIFLSIDSMIGTYLFTSANNLGIEFYGTMIINLAIIFILMQNYNRHFPK